MKIRHQSAGSDLSWTVQAPLTFETPAGDVVRIEAWSLAGLNWPEEAGECPQTGVLSVPFQGVDVRFPVRLTQPNAENHVEFEGLSGRQRETLALFYRALLSGQMASSEDVITSLDTPVDLVPMEETEEEKEASTKGRWPTPIRAALHVLVYGMVALSVATILGVSVFNSVTRINVQHGRVVAPIAEHLPASEGFVKSISVQAGDAVVAGQVLVRLKDPEAQGKLDLARAKLAQEQSELLHISQTLEALTTYHSVDAADVRAAVMGQAYARFVGDRGFETLWDRWQAMLPQNPIAAIALDPFQFAVMRLREVEAAQLAKVRGLRATRDAHKSAISLGHVRAPTNGVVHEVLVRKGQPYDHDDLAVVFEADTPRVVQGWVSERFADTIFVGMSACIGINALGQKQTIAGLVTDVEAGADPRRPGEFGIIVTVTPRDLSAAETKDALRQDAPVNLEVRRPWAQRLIDHVQTLWSRDV
ncbi:biotin/lipoyl-binding protein [uncultured Shimia sp.]|uniref:HlyD family efflux transporter periplasmic adaptor subunit n=1 Tax=uncultured Shimia sp. TaxID=573152 RepID=UPI0025D72430|nr:biotin/lipoyl-binding protein [uncultured Shimia sp.]